MTALVKQMNPASVEGENRSVVYPHEDPQVARTLRKIVRGLSHFHGLGTALADTQVFIQPALYWLPESIRATLTFTHREEDILKYAFTSERWEDVISFWQLTIFDRTAFFGIVLDPSKNSAPVTGGE